MSFRILLAAPLVLLACAPTNNADMSVDAAGAARAAASPPELTAVAEALNARRGTSLSAESNLKISAAEARGDQLFMQFQDARPASAFGPAAREGYQIQTERDMRQSFCSQPALASLVNAYSVQINIVTSDNQPLATVTVDEC